jgi:transcription-repair coupling factor
MRNIISYFPREELSGATNLFKGKRNVTFSGAGNSSSKALILSDIFRCCDKEVDDVLWIVSDEQHSNTMKKSLEVWGSRPVFIYKKMKEEEALSFPTNNDFKKRQNQNLLEFIYRIGREKPAIFITDFVSLLQSIPSKKELLSVAIKVKKGDSLDVVSFIESLVSLGYEVSEEEALNKGQYIRKGDSIIVFPLNEESPFRVNLDFDKVSDVFVLNTLEDISSGEKVEELVVFPAETDGGQGDALSLFSKNSIIVDDEVDVVDEYYSAWNSFLAEATENHSTISFSSFNDDVKNHLHMHFLSVLKFRTAYDFANDLKDKISMGWKTLFFTKRIDEVSALFNDQKIPHKVGLSENNFSQSSVFIIDVQKEDVFPQSFQSPVQKISLITDKDVSFFKENKKRPVSSSVFDDFLTSLKYGDYIVHADHGIARFLGLDQKTIDDVTKEYLKLGYAENDKLFVPIDQADKVNKYIGSEETMPKLTRLGSAEWNTITSKVRKETEKIAKELLALYAERRAAKGYPFKADDDIQTKFDAAFEYEETPGQIKAIEDVKRDMEKKETMDRLVCGDVGFGKTEVAMRATFKAFLSGKQVAVVAPITILANQHYKSFKKRMEEFHVRVEMLSRFRTQKEQKIIVEKLQKGEVDVIIGTHRLLQADIKFKNLGLVIIDEEQRFGVKQKEALKSLRKEVDVLTLTATPIPRTLNICLNKLWDITTITTPPFGRLPVITEVRKYSPSLVREAIKKEVDRGGQVYFLHNRVQTIDSFAEGLKKLIPEARIVVAHGQLGSNELEERILSFVEHKFDVLVSSTIIENGIDLSNANTLIVNNAEKFGLAQLYQLRGRVGRGKKQAYAYFLYHGQRLKLDAKKRLRAIVEASDLGSGFQIAMKDLEIRGAGNILGANQHGVINVVGVAHFMRMLNRAVEDIKAGRVMEGEDEITDVSVELPVHAYVPDFYISDSKDKISAYQRLSSADTKEYLEEIKREMVEDYGKMPKEVLNLFKIIDLKILAKKAGIINIKSESVPMSTEKEIVLQMSKQVKPGNIVNLLEYNQNWRIVGSSLRINKAFLGSDWFDGLEKCLEKLAASAKHGAPKK